jgi:hypothetical protein
MSEPQTAPETAPAQQAPAKISTSFAEAFRRAESRADAASAQKQAKAKSPVRAEPAAPVAAPIPPAETTAAKTSAPDATPAPDLGAKRTQLEALAKELGLELDDRSITSKDYAGFQARKRRTQAQLEAREKEVTAQLARVAKYLKADEHASRGELIEMIEALGVDPNELNKAQAGRLDPAWQAKREVERLKSEIEAKARAEADKQAAYEKDTRYRAACENHRSEITASLAGDENPAMQAASRESWFVEQVRRRAEEAWRTDQEELSPLRAARLVLDDMRKAQENFSRILSGSPAGDPEPESDPEASGAETVPERGRTPKAPKAVSHRTAADTGNAAKRPLTETEWKRKFSKLLSEADR